MGKREDEGKEDRWRREKRGGTREEEIGERSEGVMRESGGERREERMEVVM